MGDGGIKVLLQQGDVETDRGVDPLHRRPREDPVGGDRVDLAGASVEHRLGGVAEGAGGVDDVVDEEHWSGPDLEGVHLEGPFISPKFPGAQRADQIRPPDVTEFAALLQAGPVRMITLAPEVDGAAQLMAMARAEDVVVVVGHTNADYDVCQAAFAAGASQATHTYNAMTGLHHRRPGTLGAVLTNDTVDAQLIADNIHVHPAAMEILARCKGPQRTLLITDAMRAAGLPPGRYELGGQPVTVANHACRLEDGTLAGSVLTMERALANFMAANSWPLHKAWPATSRNAARALGMDDRLGEIKSGYWADLVLLDEELTVVATIVDGQVVYLRDEERLHG